MDEFLEIASIAKLVHQVDIVDGAHHLDESYDILVLDHLQRVDLVDSEVVKLGDLLETL
jgi:hypothetical protein